tara:strand:- start:2 stop:421 length:420 start_codon:yes stop_codon:yes gene_type:complete
MIIRKILLKDYNNYIKLIDSNITFEKFSNFINNILNDKHIILVIEDENELIGTGTLLIEDKITYGGCKLGHIENIFIHENCRGLKLGIKLVDELIKIAKKECCYRIELNCDESLIKFYEKNNFIKYQTIMSLYIKENFM